MAQMTKEFSENLLKLSQSGRHINTTCWEEEQLIRGWLYWHEHHYLPLVRSLIAEPCQPISAGDGAALSGGSLAK